MELLKYGGTVNIQRRQRSLTYVNLEGECYRRLKELQWKLSLTHSQSAITLPLSALKK